jgi:hypothetical protein
MTKFSFQENELVVLKNFAQINPNIVVLPDCLRVRSESTVIYGMYEFEHPYDFEYIGIYDSLNFLSVLSLYKKPEIEVVENKYIIISEGDTKFKYQIHAKELILKDHEQKMYSKEQLQKADDMECNLGFTISQEKFTFLMKSANTIDAKYLFFESETGGIRITAGDSMESSNDTFDILIKDDIEYNALEGMVMVAVSELKLIPSEYKIKIRKVAKKNGDGFHLGSYWKSSLGVKYMIGMKNVEKD